MKKLILIVLIYMATLVHSTTIEDISDIRLKNQLQETSQMYINQMVLSSNADNSRGGITASVGGNSVCDFVYGPNILQTIIDSGFYSEIRLATNTIYNESLSINDVDITIRGGFSSCTNANNNIQNDSLFTEINGIPADNAPVIFIVGNTNSNIVTLENLELKNGNGNGFTPGGGLLVSADVNVSLNRVNINNNVSSAGGGIYILGSNSDIIATDTIIKNNDANYAGGVFCSGQNASLTMYGSSGVSLNTANGNTDVARKGRGGGLYLTDGCSFLSYAQKTNGIISIGGIIANQAINGGGIYAEDGSIATLFGHEICFDILGNEFCFGSNEEPFGFGSNVAQEEGGGAFITGNNTQLNIYAGYVHLNRAEHGLISQNINEDRGGTLIYLGGGAINASDGATLTTGRLSKDCWDTDKCNYFFGNTAKYSSGGAILNNGANVEISSSLFEENRADFGTVLLTQFSDSNTKIESSIFNHNGNNGTDGFLDRSVFFANSNSKIDIIYSTIADNNATNSVITIISNIVSGVRVLSSIIDDVNTGPIIDSDNSNTSFFDCVIVHENTSLGTSISVSIDNPKFKDRSNRNYHLKATSTQILSPSPAIDYCGKRANVDHKDFDFENHGFDDATIGNNLGLYDIGADETYENDIIFINGYE